MSNLFQSKVQGLIGSQCPGTGGRIGNPTLISTDNLSPSKSPPATVAPSTATMSPPPDGPSARPLLVLNSWLEIDISIYIYYIIMPLLIKYMEELSYFLLFGSKTMFIDSEEWEMMDHWLKATISGRTCIEIRPGDLLLFPLLSFYPLQ